MRVYNLTSSPVDYRGKVIPPFGSTEFPKLFNLSAKDQRLVGVLSFGSLPPGWTIPSKALAVETVPDKKEFFKIHAELSREQIQKEIVPEAKPEDVTEVLEKKDFNKKNKRY